jgi:hypothetical protein
MQQCVVVIALKTVCPKNASFALVNRAAASLPDWLLHKELQNRTIRNVTSYTVSVRYSPWANQAMHFRNGKTH